MAYSLINIKWKKKEGESLYDVSSLDREKKVKDIVMSVFIYMTLSRRSIPKIVIVVTNGDGRGDRLTE